MTSYAPGTFGNMQRDWGANKGLNYQIAADYGYDGDFGGGQFRQWAGQNLNQEQMARVGAMQNYYKTNPASATLPYGAKLGLADLANGTQPYNPQQGQDFGKPHNQDLNRDLAQTYGYTGDFGQGGFDQFRQGLTQDQNSQISRTVGDYSAQNNTPIQYGSGQSKGMRLMDLFGNSGTVGPLRSLQPYGAAPELNRQLAQQYGYRGPWGQGGWQQHQQTLTPEQQTSSQNMIDQYNSRGQ